MTGFGGHQRDLDGGAIAHFSHQDDFRGLPQGGAQSVWIIIEVMTKFSLVEGGLAFGMNKLNWILQGDNVDGLVFVNFV